jgi:hypothetical protein
VFDRFIVRFASLRIDGVLIIDHVAGVGAPMSSHFATGYLFAVKQPNEERPGDIQQTCGLLTYDL